MGEAIIDIKMFVVTLLTLRPAGLILKLGLSKVLIRVDYVCLCS
jgi:hypothetical protein